MTIEYRGIRYINSSTEVIIPLTDYERRRYELEGKGEGEGGTVRGYLEIKKDKEGGEEWIPKPNTRYSEVPIPAGERHQLSDNSHVVGG